MIIRHFFSYDISEQRLPGGQVVVRGGLSRGGTGRILDGRAAGVDQNRTRRMEEEVIIRHLTINNERRLNVFNDLL